MRELDWLKEQSRDVQIAVWCGIIVLIGLIVGVGTVLTQNHQAEVRQRAAESAPRLSPATQSYVNGQSYGRQLESRGYSFDEAYEACRDRSADDAISSLVFAQGCQAGFAED